MNSTFTFPHIRELGQQSRKVECHIISFVHSVSLITSIFFTWYFSNEELDTPRQLEIRDVTDTYAVISWSPPVAQIDAFTLSFGPSSDPSNRKSVDLAPIDTQHTADGLAPDTVYEVTLVSKRGDMTSDPATDTFTTGMETYPKSKMGAWKFNSIHYALLA